MLFAALLLAIACDKVFDVHPYDLDIKGEHGINEKNINIIQQYMRGRDTMRVAFISDTHSWYSETKAEILNLNMRGDIDFVVHCGDITDYGTTNEYIWARDLLQTLIHPYVTLVGNHDFLGTGDQAYMYMYGPMDFSFVAGDVKFVCINTNATEYDYMAPVPSFDFLEQQIADSLSARRTIVVMHAPPYSDQFNNNVAKPFNYYIHQLRGLMCCIYGHNHNNTVEEFFHDGLLFYGIDCAEDRNYRIFTITPQGYEQELVYY